LISSFVSIFGSFPFRQVQTSRRRHVLSTNYVVSVSFEVVTPLAETGSDSPAEFTDSIGAALADNSLAAAIEADVGVGVAGGLTNIATGFATRNPSALPTPVPTVSSSPTPLPSPAPTPMPSEEAEALARQKLLKQLLKLPQAEKDERLFYAAKEGGASGVSSLLAAGAKPNGHKGPYHRLPVHEASFGGHMEVVRMLLTHGAFKDARDVGGWSPLHYASHMGHLDVVRMLLTHGAKRDIQQFGSGSTPIRYAREAGHSAVVQVLLEYGAI
jgi:hypothetical protein